MPDDTPCLVLDVSDCMSWPDRFGAAGPFDPARPLRIPAGKGPTIVQPSRAIADAEAVRLAREHIGRRFAVFELAAIAARVPVVTHISLQGKPLAHSHETRLLRVGDAPDEIPF